MRPTEILKHEHKIVLTILDAAEREARAIEESGDIKIEVISKMVDFFRNFTDRCHHGKEEKHLFAKMFERGLPSDKGPVAVMLAEHDEGRLRVRAVAAALDRAAEDDPEAAASAAENLSAFAGLLRAHIGKEEDILYPLADRILTEEDQQTLIEAFEKVEAEEMGEGFHEKYHKLAHELAES